MKKYLLVLGSVACLFACNSTTEEKVSEPVNTVADHQSKPAAKVEEKKKEVHPDFIEAGKKMMENIANVRASKKSEGGEQYCTPSYWDTERDPGKRFFKRMCKKGPEIELKVSGEEGDAKRGVLTVDYINEGKKRDELYIYLVREGDQWLMDGANESKIMIPLFLKGEISGHFNPKELPDSPELTKLGEEIVKFDKDKTGLEAYLKNSLPFNTANPNYDAERIARQITETEYGKIEVKKAGYNETWNKGYIYLFSQSETKSYMRNHVTLYVSKKADGNYEVYGYSTSRPSSRSFFRKKK